MSKISSKYTDKLSEEANNSLSFVMGVQENYRRNIEEVEEERDSFINAFLDQSATDGNKGKCSKFFKPPFVLVSFWKPNIEGDNFNHSVI